MCDAHEVRRTWWLVILLVSLASAPVVFVTVARNHVGEPRPVGTVCDFEHDPGSGKSGEGRVKHRGWLVRREVCVHATDGENEQQVGLAPFLGALVAPVATGVVLTLLAAWWSRARKQDNASGSLSA